MHSAPVTSEDMGFIQRIRHNEVGVMHITTYHGDTVVSIAGVRMNEHGATLNRARQDYQVVEPTRYLEID